MPSSPNGPCPLAVDVRHDIQHVLCISCGEFHATVQHWVNSPAKTWAQPLAVDHSGRRRCPTSFDRTAPARRGPKAPQGPSHPWSLSRRELPKCSWAAPRFGYGAFSTHPCCFRSSETPGKVSWANCVSRAATTANDIPLFGPVQLGVPDRASRTLLTSTAGPPVTSHAEHDGSVKLCC